MNLYFKYLFLLLFSIQTQARTLFVITFQQKDYENAHRIKKILIDQHAIPSKAIVLNNKEIPCVSDKSTILHICINKNSEYKIINQDRDVLKRSFAHLKK
ncbi:MAG: hypothetical protein HN576_15215 [Bacteriovoracaceae bacterium]|jgi:hypothetical protein|nr:hypothetical protein [Bacteriovoracaceae bacterium]